MVKQLHDKDTGTTRRPGRPPSYVFDKPDEQLSELERRLKLAVMKRRLRQNRNYHRRKLRNANTDTSAPPPHGLDKSLAADTDVDISPSLATASDGSQKENTNSKSAVLDVFHLSDGGEVSAPAPREESLEDLFRLPFMSSTTIPTSFMDETFVANAPFADPAGTSLHRKGELGGTAPANSSSMSSPVPGFPDQFADTDVRHGGDWTREIEHAPEILSSAVGDAGVDKYAANPSSSTDSGGTTSISVKYCCPVPELPVANIDEDSSYATAFTTISVPEPVSLDLEVFGRTNRFSESETAGFSASVDDARARANKVDVLSDGVADETELLLDELLDLEMRTSYTSSAAMMRMGTSSVAFSLASLPRPALLAAHALSVFQDSFDQTAALAMIGQGISGLNVSAFEPLFARNLLAVADNCPGSPRFTLNPLVRHALPTSLPRVNEYMSDGPSSETAMLSLPDGSFVDLNSFPSQDLIARRFVAHYGTILAILSDTPSINRNGMERYKAMRFFDAERKNVKHALHLAAVLGSKIELDFLRKGAAVIRYCTDAKTRALLFQSALDGTAYPADETTSMFSVINETPELLGSVSYGTIGMENQVLSSTGSLPPEAMAEISYEPGPVWPLEPEECMPGEIIDVLNPKSQDPEVVLAEADDNCVWWHNTARIYLALGEAYFDMLRIDKAEKPLEKALDILDLRNRRPECPLKTASVVLANLLLAEIRALRGDTETAKRKLYYALSLLSGAGMTESTYTVNAMNTLVNVQMSSGSYEDALRTSSKMLDILVSLGYDEMPIYADALGTTGVVYLNMKHLDDAERLFCKALEVINTWFAKAAWKKLVPYEHCQDLDIWLLEGLAKVNDAQGNIVQADSLRENALRKRAQRGLCDIRIMPDPDLASLEPDDTDPNDIPKACALGLETFRSGPGAFLRAREELKDIHLPGNRRAVLLDSFRDSGLDWLSYPRHAY
jgi:tetratricopeptide (TPR) repeat protein